MQRVNESLIRAFTTKTITKEWTDSFVVCNAFKPPMFQGEDAFNKCVELLAKEWQRITQILLKDALVCLDQLVECGGVASLDQAAFEVYNKCKMEHDEEATWPSLSAMVVPLKMRKGSLNKALYVPVLKRIYKQEVRPVMEARLDERAHQAAKRFNTMNTHYLFENFTNLMPGLDVQACRDEAIERLWPKLTKTRDSEEVLAGILFDEVAKVIEERKTALKKTSSLEFTRERVYAAVKAYNKLNQKKYLDDILNDVRSGILDPWQEFVASLRMHDVLRKGKFENACMVKQRQMLLAQEASMKGCIEELEKLESN